MTTTSRARWARSLTVIVGVLAIVSLSQSASAQTASAADWQHGTALMGYAGVQSASSDVKGAAGAGFGWAVTPHLAVEGRGTWFGDNASQSDFAATLAAHVPLMSARMVAPFVTFGAGMYRATVNGSATDVPQFYRSRMTDPVGTRTFQDFAVLMGGGLDVFVSGHVALRPDASVMLVMTGSDVRPVGVYGVQLVYHFHEHHIE